MQIAAVDDDRRLYVSSAIDDWALVDSLSVHVVVDLERDLDAGVPTVPGRILYLYFPFEDDALPELRRLEATSRYLADLYRRGDTLLLHCSMGLNRSALLAASVLHHLGWNGPDAVARLRERRPGALFNDVFCEYVLGLGQESAQ